jgi:glutamate synthase domain-containing protein 1/glutamate synthase domain-containing protein 3
VKGKPMTSKEPMRKEVEGGCGVVGCASEKPIAGKHFLISLEQMHNRGNGKGGGLAVCGCFPDYREFYALQIASLMEGAHKIIEEEFIIPYFSIEKRETQPQISDFREIKGLEIKPPEVYRYFCRVKAPVLEKFARERGFKDLIAAEDQFLYENSFEINKRYYADIEDKAAFVLSHGKNSMVLKGVGYAEHFILYYCLENFLSPIWIGHQRYPTRGRVWHPGGAHPFVGLHEALVHNGDFANYHSVSEYLSQKGIYPLFLTDTEVSVLLFDYYSRTLGYDLELIIEALAPTTERDFDLLSKQRQRLYRAVRAAHIHGSPDGPWFFIVARYLPDKDISQLIGITDTSMLRPHVFALSGDSRKIGLVASEKQAIDSVLESLSKEDPQVCAVAERYWISRGGSHTDGGSFAFTLDHGALTVTDKFQRVLRLREHDSSFSHERRAPTREKPVEIKNFPLIFEEVAPLIKDLDYGDIKAFITRVVKQARENEDHAWRAIEELTRLHDRYYNIGERKRNWIQVFIMEGLRELFLLFPEPSVGGKAPYVRIGYDALAKLPSLSGKEKVLLLDARGFPQEGCESISSSIVAAYGRGVRKFAAYNLKGDRFIGCGLGPRSHGVRIDLYGSSGDYLGSGIDGAEIYVHNSAQDQVGQIMNDGKLVIFGDVGQTFLYGAKGGAAYVMGNTGGRPLINSVGNIRAIINGTCLDYAAESFMAGAEVGGGFILINGLRPSLQGEFIGLEDKYPGGNFFSLASGGAGYLNDPYRTVVDEQLNGGEFTEFTHADWEVISPYLKENQELFGISINRDLLTVDRVKKSPHEVFRKVISKGGVLSSAEHKSPFKVLESAAL